MGNGVLSMLNCTITTCSHPPLAHWQYTRNCFEQWSALSISPPTSTRKTLAVPVLQDGQRSCAKGADQCISVELSSVPLVESLSLLFIDCTYPKLTELKEIPSVQRWLQRQPHPLWAEHRTGTQQRGSTGRSKPPTDLQQKPVRYSCLHYIIGRCWRSFLSFLDGNRGCSRSLRSLDNFHQWFQNP